MKIKTKPGSWRCAILATALCVPAMTSCTKQASKSADGRSSLPVAQPVPKKLQRYSPSAHAKTFSVDAPKDAPNVVIVLLDDVGFGALSPFGGRNMPTLQKLADNGLSYKISTQQPFAHQHELPLKAEETITL